MPVIINDLEVVVDADALPEEESRDRPAPAPMLRPEDIHDIVARQARMLVRVLAH